MPATEYLTRFYELFFLPFFSTISYITIMHYIGA